MRSPTGFLGPVIIVVGKFHVAKFVLEATGITIYTTSPSTPRISGRTRPSSCAMSPPCSLDQCSQASFLSAFGLGWDGRQV